MSGVSLATIKDIECGKGNPFIDTVRKILVLLGMEIKFEIRQTVKQRRFSRFDEANLCFWCPRKNPCMERFYELVVFNCIYANGDDFGLDGGLTPNT